MDYWGLWQEYADDRDLTPNLWKGPSKPKWWCKEPPEAVVTGNPWNDTKISIPPTLNWATGGEQPERTGMFCWKGSQPQPSFLKGGAGASWEEQHGSSTQLHTALSSRGGGFCPECPMKPTEHMNKNAGVYYALSSTASWNRLLVKRKSGM